MREKTRETSTMRGGLRWLFVVLPVLIVSAPLIYLSPGADERFKVYLYGADWVSDPVRAVTYPLGQTVDFLQLGNFRPIGRIIEHTNFMGTELLMRLTGGSLNLGLGLVRILSLVILACVVYLFVDRVVNASGLRSRKWGFLAPTAVSFAPFIVAFGSASSFVIFSGMYIQSAALTLLLAMIFLRSSLHERRAIRPHEWVVYGLAGLLMAATNEIVNIAFPLAVIVFISGMRMAHLRSVRYLWSLAGTRLLATTSAFFLAVFVPVRLYILRACNEGPGACYRNSDVDFSGLTLGVWWKRLTAGLPYSAWKDADSFSALVSRGLIAFLVIALIVFLFVRFGGSHSSNLSRASTATADSTEAVNSVARRLLIIGLTVVVLAATLSSLSSGLQLSTRNFGWRESALSATGWSLVIVALFGYVIAFARTSAVSALAFALVAGASIPMSTYANTERRDSELSSELRVADDYLGFELASFADNSLSHANRCKVQRDHLAAYQDLEDQHSRIMDAVNHYTETKYGKEFC